MEAQTIDAFDQLLLRKRSIIETINDQLKNIFNLEHCVIARWPIICLVSS
jgi:hypothetical protein